MGGTWTGKAIDTMVNDLFGEGNGARSKEENVPRVGIVMTDGQSSDYVMDPANNARSEGIILFAIGIGDAIVESELLEIANDPDERYVFQVNNFNVIDNIRSLVSKEACKGNALHVFARINFVLRLLKTILFYSDFM